MEWNILILGTILNLIRNYLGLCLVSKIQGFPKIEKKMYAYCVAVAFVVAFAAQNLTNMSQQLCLEGALLFLYVYVTSNRKPGRGLFLILFYEVAVYLWEFIATVVWAILLHKTEGVSADDLEQLQAVLFVRFAMIAIAVLIDRKEYNATKAFQLARYIVIATMFAIVVISEQSLIKLDEDLVFTNLVWAMVLIFAILAYNLSYQYEMEKTVARLLTEQSELLQKDYEKLNKIYTANARLYHDLHNHLEIIRSGISQGKMDEALQYLDALQAPIKNITKTIWTGDEAIDYLLNSKLAVMKEENIKSVLNIEFPPNTNISSVDLSAVLGNLLDNALEAVKNCDENRFINLTIRRINHMLIIKVENSYSSELVLDNGELKTTKKDKNHHGWGLKSVHVAAEQYNGTLETSFQDNTFRAIVTMFF